MQKLRSWSSEYSHILLISIFILFTELFLIRWISTEIRIFAYVNNLVLLACFVGLGLGSLLDKRFGNLLYSVISIFLLALASTSNHFLNITEQIGSFSDQLIWYLDDQPINWIQPVRGILSTLLLFAFIVAVFIPPGQILARLLSSAKILHSDIQSISLEVLWVSGCFQRFPFCSCHRQSGWHFP